MAPSCIRIEKNSNILFVFICTADTDAIKIWVRYNKIYSDCNWYTLTCGSALSNFSVLCEKFASQFVHTMHCLVMCVQTFLWSIKTLSSSFFLCLHSICLNEGCADKIHAQQSCLKQFFQRMSLNFADFLIFFFA